VLTMPKVSTFCGKFKPHMQWNVQLKWICISSETDKLHHHLLSGATVYFIYKYSLFLGAQCRCPEVKQWGAVVDEVRCQSLNTGPWKQTGFIHTMMPVSTSVCDDRDTDCPVGNQFHLVKADCHKRFHCIFPDCGLLDWHNVVLWANTNISQEHTTCIFRAKASV
jgi:hypothetical protein